MRAGSKIDLPAIDFSKVVDRHANLYDASDSFHPSFLSPQAKKKKRKKKTKGKKKRNAVT